MPRQSSWGKRSSEVWVAVVSRAGAQHVVATKSGHCIQTTEPDLVIAAVRQVVEAARRGLSVVVTRDLSGLSEEFAQRARIRSG